jgi:hypothetical protein
VKGDAMKYSKKEVAAFFKVRLQKTPSEASHYALGWVCSVLAKDYAEPLKMSEGDMCKYFYEVVWPPILANLCSIPSDEIQSFFLSADTSCMKGDTNFGDLEMALMVCSYVARCLNDTENERQAWGFAIEANYWAGALAGTSARRSDVSYALSKNGRIAAGARHAENHAVAEDIHKWYSLNHQNYTSLDSAAAAVMKVVPLR